MNLLVLLLSLLIGVQTQTLEELNKQLTAIEKEYDDTNLALQEAQQSIIKEKDEANVIEEFIWAAENETERIENQINNAKNEFETCEITKTACLKDENETRPLRDRLNGVKQEEERHRNELKALENEPKNDTDNLNDLNRELNESQNNLKLLEAEMQQLRLKLSKCGEESKYPKVTNQSTGKEKTDGGGFINKIITSTLDKVLQLKKSIANVLRSKINCLKFKVPV